jgi:F0F1-type ATP synthase membrane subunit a
VFVFSAYGMRCTANMSLGKVVITIVLETNAEVLPLCVALPALPRKAGLPILIGFVQQPRP